MATRSTQDRWPTSADRLARPGPQARPGHGISGRLVCGHGAGQEQLLPRCAPRSAAPVLAAEEVGEQPAAIGIFHKAAVPGGLHTQLWILIAADQRIVRHKFVRTGKRFGAGNRSGVSSEGAAFRREQVIPTVFFINMRTFHQAQFCAAKNIGNRTDEGFFLLVIFLPQ